MNQVCISMGLAFGLLLTACGADDSGGVDQGGAGGTSKGGTASGGAGGYAGAARGGEGGTSNGGQGGAGKGGQAGAGQGGQGGTTSQGGAAPVGPVACEPFAACGGNLIGTWRLNNSCVNDATKAKFGELAKVCEQGTASLTGWKVTGTTTIDAQSIFYDGAVTLSFATSFPLSCVEGVSSCSEFEATLTGQPGIAGAICQTAAMGCSCTYDQVIENESQYAYTQTGSTFTEKDPSDGSMKQSEYCVQGDTLRIKSPESVDVYTH